MDQKTLTQLLIEASTKYYNGENSGMSDLEFDKKIEELRIMESTTGVVLEGSPTITVGAKVVTELKKVTHEQPALSLDKVKYRDRETLVKWLKNSEGHDSAVISWKNDGLTVVATYDDGKLTSAVTRGDGIEGSDITHNARFFKGLPQKISYDGHFVVRGEAVMTFAEFERINAEMNGEYENPRNLASATIQMLDSNESKKREIRFIAFELVSPEAINDEDEMMMPIKGREWTDLRYQQDRFEWLKYLGFDVVDYDTCDSMDVLQKIEEFKNELENLDYPTDGLVITFNDMVYGMSLGATGHHFRHSLALKWSDETKETTIREIEWSVGKTGIITPVAVFDTVRLGLGSDVSRASLHNVSILERLAKQNDIEAHGVDIIGSKADVYMANMIIPQIASITHTDKTSTLELPKTCPICGMPTVLTDKNGIKVLHCDNSRCPAREVGNLVNSFSKDGLFVKGLAENQIQDLIEEKLVDPKEGVLSFFFMQERVQHDHTFKARYNHLMQRDGWGWQKYSNIANALEMAKDTTLQKFLYSLNIPLCGNDLSKKLSKFWHGNVEEFKAFVEEVHLCTSEACGRMKMTELLKSIEGVGEEKALNVVLWAEEITAYREKWGDFICLISILRFPEVKESSSDNSLEGYTFVITGSVHEYKNRDEFKASVEARGGKVAGSVSAKTSLLVNNDVTSGSGKNKKAKELGIEIISEDEFISRFGK